MVIVQSNSAMGFCSRRGWSCPCRRVSMKASSRLRLSPHQVSVVLRVPQGCMSPCQQHPRRALVDHRETRACVPQRPAIQPSRLRRRRTIRTPPSNAGQCEEHASARKDAARARFPARRTARIFPRWVRRSLSCSKSLFGHLLQKLVFPIPSPVTVSGERLHRAARQICRRCQQHIDPRRIDQEAEIPPDVVAGTAPTEAVQADD